MLFLCSVERKRFTKGKMLVIFYGIFETILNGENLFFGILYFFLILCNSLLVNNFALNVVPLHGYLFIIFF